MKLTTLRFALDYARSALWRLSLTVRPTRRAVVGRLEQR